MSVAFYCFCVIFAKNSAVLFNSLEFLFFLPIVFALYWLCAGRANLRNLVIVIASYAFYGWWDYRFLALLALSTASSYASGIAIERCKERKIGKWICAANVVFNLSILAFFKYFNFFGENFARIMDTLGWHTDWVMLDILLPVGISFYTFQIVSYAVDVYRGEAPAQRKLVDLAAYIAMFPQLIAGPIVRYADIAPQLQEREHSWEKCAAGVRRFIWGLGKKVLIANSLGELCAAFKASGDRSLLFFWLYAVGYALHIYFDFSGYSDMAIGLGKLFGFEFRENFRYPFVSGSLTEFWRRWLCWWRRY